MFNKDRMKALEDTVISLLKQLIEMENTNADLKKKSKKIESVLLHLCNETNSGFVYLSKPLNLKFENVSYSDIDTLYNIVYQPNKLD